MLQKFYDVEMNQIADFGKIAAQELSVVAKQYDPENTVIVITEDHCQLTQSLMQMQFMSELKKEMDFKNSFELPEECFELAIHPKKDLWNGKFSTALKNVHSKDNIFYMGACLTPSYVLSKINPTFLCADTAIENYMVRDTREQLATREIAMVENMRDYQDKNKQALIHVGGGSHIFDCIHLGRSNMLDMLLENKTVLLLNMIEEYDWDDQLRFLSDKITGLSDPVKSNLAASINVKLPCYEVESDRKVFRHWDKIVLENDLPDLILSKKNKLALKRNKFSLEVA